MAAVTDQTSSQGTKLRKLFSLVLRTAIVVGCMVYAFWGLDYKAFGEALLKFDPLKLAGLLALCFFQFVPVGFRLSYLTRSKAGIWTSIKASIFCLGMNNIFPAKLGEVAKAFYLRRHCEIPVSQGLGLVFWERFFDLNFLLLLGLATAAMMGQNAAVLPLGVFVGGVWVCLVLLRLFPATAGFIERLIPVERARLLFKEVLGQLQAVAKPSFLIVLAAYSAVVWTVFVSFMAALLLWLGGQDMTMAQVLTVFVLASLGMAVPSSPGALGVFEGAMVWSLGLFAVPQEEALALGLVMRIVTFVPPVLIALAMMARSGLSVDAIRKSGGEDL